VAVLGLMAEIDDPPAGHRLVAAHAARLGIEVVAVAVDVYGVTPVEDPIRALGPLGPGDVVLVKRIAVGRAAAGRAAARRRCRGVGHPAGGGEGAPSATSGSTDAPRGWLVIQVIVGVSLRLPAGVSFGHCGRRSSFWCRATSTRFVLAITLDREDVPVGILEPGDSAAASAG
jgi:hypothetical protein